MEQLAQPWGSEQQQQEPLLTMEQQLQVAQEEHNELIKTLDAVEEGVDVLEVPIKGRPVTTMEVSVKRRINGNTQKSVMRKHVKTHV